MSHAPAPVSCVLLDFDGTLANTTATVVDSYRHAFRTVLGYEFPSTEEDLADALTTRLRELCARRAGAQAAELFDVFRAHYTSDHTVAPSLYGGVLEMFEGLAKRGRSVGLVTNKTRMTALFEIQRCGLGAVDFRCVITADEATIGKPDPMPILMGLRAVATAPENTIYVGDGPHDVVAACRAGVRAVGAAYGDFGTAKLKEEAPWAVIDSPLELLQVLDSMPGSRA